VIADQILDYIAENGNAWGEPKQQLRETRSKAEKMETLSSK
jgi:hypothetical protein